jgi:nucleotide-binding universal stress UspA family protein
MRSSVFISTFIVTTFIDMSSLGGLKPVAHPRLGDEEILAAAAAANAGTIFVGRSERRHLTHGSLDSRLVRAAQADVLVVP